MTAQDVPLSPEAANEAVSVIGELFPDCVVCCTAQTGGDLCGPCGKALGIVARAMDDFAAYRLRESEKAGAALAEALGRIDEHVTSRNHGAQLDPVLLHRLAHEGVLAWSQRTPKAPEGR